MTTPVAIDDDIKELFPSPYNIKFDINSSLVILAEYRMSKMAAEAQRYLADLRYQYIQRAQWRRDNDPEYAHVYIARFKESYHQQMSEFAHHSTTPII